MNMQNINDISVLLKIYFSIFYSYILISLDYAGIPEKTFVVMIILMTVDTLTGIWKGYILKELSSSPITTGILRKSGILIALYMIFLGNSIVPELGFIANLFVGLFVLAELISIVGNIVAIREKYKISEHDALIQVSEILKDLFKKKGKVDDGNN
ncbi:phage holin family protein [Aliarcobacter butzleri]|uniref:phage holin family protein n=1 Tax=Aliarcobacter butzleri TaxID=28197 RepID=UPI00263EAE74|nr:phage holin family protein [Aliarcobacter butzleri]MDN5077659.1 phage holin family protein [Aliarcobacter butzleri]MDN5118793.1 phage holin family protein [Aliarcobacter butzleri]